MSPALVVVTGAFVLAFAFGFLAARSQFCVMGAVSDAVNMQHWGRARLWLLAAGSAILLSQAVFLAGWADLSRSIYQRPVLPWLSILAGGFVFGVGMTLAGGCPNKNLLRLGAGSLRSLVVLMVAGLAAYATLKGVFAPMRVELLDRAAIDLTRFGLQQQGLGPLVARATDWSGNTALLACTLLLGGGALAAGAADRELRAEPGRMAAALALGALVAAGWFLSGHLGHGEHPETLEEVYFATNSRTLESFSFVAPLAYSLELLTLWTDKSLRITFGIASVAGIAAGAWAEARLGGHFRWEGFASLQDLRRNLGGAVLMGVGGVTAMGCTIGHGLSGVSTLAPGSMLALAAIVAGSAVTMRWLAR